PPLDSIDLYPFIQKQLAALRMNHFSIDSAAFIQTKTEDSIKSSLRVPGIHLYVNRFELDSSSRIGPDNLLYAKDFEVQIDGFFQKLSDSTHQIEVGKVAWSHARQQLRIKDVHLQPGDSSWRFQDGKVRSELYQLYVPEVAVEGLDMYELYQDRVLELDRIHIRTPQFWLTEQPTVDSLSIDSIAQADPYQLISQQLKSLRVHRLVVFDGSVQLPTNDAQQPIRADDILILITNFQLDSAARAKTDNPFYADDIAVSLNANDYRFVTADSAYEVLVGDISISTTDSSVTAEYVQLNPRWGQPKIEAATNVFEAFVPRISLTGINPRELYFDRKIDLTSLRMFRPRVRWYVQNSLVAGPPESSNLYDRLPQALRDLQIGNIRLESASLHQVLPPGDTLPPIKLPVLHAEFKQLQLDSLPLIRPDRYFYAHSFSFQLERPQMPILDSLFTVKLKQLRYNSADKLCTIDSLKWLPNYDVVQYAIDHGYTRDKLWIQTHRIEAEDLDLYTLLVEKKLVVPKLHIGGFDLRSYKDKRFSRKPGPKPMPQELIAQVKPYFRIDSLWIRSGRLAFSERSQTLGDTGKMHIDNLEGLLTNLTNDSLLTAQRRPLTIDAAADLMGEGHIQARFDIPLGDPNNAYTFSGTMDSMRLTSLNPMIEPQGAFRIKSGIARRAEFRVRTNQFESKGKMRFWYDDFHVTIMDSKLGKDFERRYSRRGFATALANSFVLKSRNPKRRFLRVGRIDYVPEREKMFFGHWVQSLLSGVKSSVGLSSKEEKDKLFGRKRSGK
ncbi:MAG: hypothetical protein AAF206_04820, partial [Bacteroidota bacterium]